MKSIKIVAFILCVMLLPTVLSAAVQPYKNITYLGYNPDTKQNDLSFNITYQFPDSKKFGPGPYPLFMWTVATYEWNKDVLSMTFVNQMVNRGFVGASVQYHNLSMIQLCNDYTVRAQSIYESTRVTSAAGVMCSQTGVNCNKGIVTAGISQGAALSVLAANYNPNVKASFGMSISDTNQTGVGVDLSSCLDAQFTAIPSNRLTIVNGSHDMTFGGQAPLMRTTGITCADGAMQCWSPDGSGAGWYLIQDSQVKDGNADHCYEMNGDCSLAIFDTNWYLPSSYNWSLKPNLDWLATLGTRRVFSPTGY